MLSVRVLVSLLEMVWPIWAPILLLKLALFLRRPPNKPVNKPSNKPGSLSSAAAVVSALALV